EDGIRDRDVTGVQTCALPIYIKSFNNFKKVTAPIVKVLNDMGVKAEMKGRNDVVVDDKKISGNAQFSTGRRMFTHGTLLLNSDQIGRASCREGEASRHARVEP